MFLWSFPNLFGLYLFTTAAVALVTQKALIITLHGPFPLYQVIFLGPFAFLFDILTMFILFHGLTAKSPLWRHVAAFFAVVVVICSSGFVSMYMEANAEMVWARSVEVS
jgi:hypothetical protein